MGPDKHWQQMVRILEELEKLKTTIESVVAGDDTSIAEPRANPQVVDKCENNVDLMIKRAEELREQSIEVLRRELEPTFRERYAEAVRDLNAALSVAVEKNQIVLSIFNAAQRLFGQSQTVIRLLTWKELLIDHRSESKLLAWRNDAQREGYLPPD